MTDATDTALSLSPPNENPLVDSSVTMATATVKTTSTLTSVVFDPKSSSIETRLVATSTGDPRNDDDPPRNKRPSQSSLESFCDVENQFGNILENPRNRISEIEDEDDEDDEDDDAVEWRRSAESETIENVMDGKFLECYDGGDDVLKRKHGYTFYVPSL